MELQNLALRIVNDPETGLQAAMEQYAPMVKAILAGILPGRQQDLEECMADVFVALWKNARSLCANQTPVKAWLIVTARNTGINRYRALRRKTDLPLTDELAAVLADELAGPGQSPAEAEALAEELVAALPPPDREIFLRKYYLMQPARQIAAALGLSESNVNTRLSRGRERLRAALKEKGVYRNGCL